MSAHLTARLFADYLRRYRPYKPYWNYEDGCILLGCIRMYEAAGDAFYADFVLDYLAQRVQPDGSIPSYLAAAHNLDSFNCSKALFFAARMTGEERYRKAIRWQAGQLAHHPRTQSGMVWHKGIYPEQVWIDGVYMAAPFYAEYAAMTGNTEICREIGRWFRFLRERLCSPRTGLYYHALDEAKQQKWADPQTGLSRTHWLRGEGWLLMALSDTAALLPETEPALRIQLSAQLSEAAGALLRYQAADGLFYQVIDRPELPQNYTESSGSLMAACAMMRGAAAGALPEAYFRSGAEILAAVREKKLCIAGDSFRLTDICGAAGLGGEPLRDGSADYYLSEARTDNDPKGIGALMMAEAAGLRGLRRTEAKQ